MVYPLSMIMNNRGTMIKQTINLLNLFPVLMISILLSYHADGQKSKQTDIGNLIQSKNFVFRAQSVLPSRGSFRYLTSDYDLRIHTDTMISYLPYFGEAYVAPIGQTRGPLDFTSTKFTYDVRPDKKGGWDITLSPKDNSDVQQMLLHVSSDGNASLSVNSINEQPISFNGVVTARRKRE